jgi:hypothetical protein
VSDHGLHRRLGGGSSGAVVMAIESIRERIETGLVCVAILAGRGERCLDTIYSDEWVLSHSARFLICVKLEYPVSLSGREREGR